MRSFSNLWYWIALSVFWSSASHWVVGVPFDMITRARKHGGEAQAHLEAISAINAGRILFIVRQSGAWIVAFAAFVLSVLATLGFAFRVEFAQAVLFLFAPMVLLFALSVRTARRIEAGPAEGEGLVRMLIRHRMLVQGLGMVAIFVTAMFGMWHNLHISLLRGG